jgi:hypothetical protein
MTLFEKILEEKTVIDPLFWLIKIEDKVNKDHEEIRKSYGSKI